MNKKILKLARKLYRNMDFSYDICNSCKEKCLEFDSDTTQPHHYPCEYIMLAEKLYRDSVIVREEEDLHMMDANDHLMELIKHYKRRAYALEQVLEFFVSKNSDYTMDDALDMVKEHMAKLEQTNNEKEEKNI